MKIKERITNLLREARKPIYSQEELESFIEEYKKFITDLSKKYNFPIKNLHFDLKDKSFTIELVYAEDYEEELRIYWAGFLNRFSKPLFSLNLGHANEVFIRGVDYKGSRYNHFMKGFKNLKELFKIFTNEYNNERTHSMLSYIVKGK